MDVLVGPSFTIDVPSSPPPPPPPYDADRPDPSFGFFSGDSSASSSSIGTPDDTDDENDAVSSKRYQNDEKDEEEVHSKLKSLTSLDSLEEALPIKRGLSNHFIGKSKSFTDLSQVGTVKELQKQENPFNKRKRVLMASKLTKKSSFYAWSNPKSMPLLPLHEDEDDSEEDKPQKVSQSCSSSSTSEEKKKQQVPQSYVSHMRHRLGSFKCRSLSDLKEHDEEEEHDDDDDYDDDHDYEDNDEQCLG